MEFGVFSLMNWPQDRSQVDVYRNEMNQLCLAESQGYDQAWFAEHLFYRYGIAPSTHLNVAHLAGRTSTIRIGTAVTITPFVPPLRLAGEIAMLDILCEGRFDWGAGRGYQRHEFDAMGVDISKSHLIFREQLEICKLAWQRQEFGYQGEIFQVPEGTLSVPNPVQGDSPPVFVAALSPDTTDWAAKHHYPIMSDQFAPLESLEKVRRRFHATAAEHDFDSRAVKMPMLRQTYVGKTMKEAREKAGPALLWYYRHLASVASPAAEAGQVPDNYDSRRYFGVGGLNPDEDPEAFLANLFENCTIIGDPAYCIDKLQEYRERCDLNHVIAWQNYGCLSHEDTLASQQRLADEVMPHFK